MSILRKVAYWCYRLIYYISLILAAGTVVGSLLFLMVGLVFFDNYTAIFLIKKGASVGFRYAGVWAGGVSIVLCILRAQKEYVKSRNQEELCQQKNA